jgi:hypothetical protein
MDPAFLAKVFGQSAIAAAVLAAILGVLAVHFGTRASASKDAAAARIQQESRQAIAAAEVRASDAAALDRGASEHVVALEAQVQEQRERADAAARELRALQARVAPRSLSDQQITRLVEELKPFTGTHVDVVELIDPEVAPFSDQLHQAFTSSGWTVSRSRVGFMVPQRYGVTCEHQDGDAAADALMRWLRAEHVAVSEIKSRAFSVVVGLRPPA